MLKLRYGNESKTFQLFGIKKIVSTIFKALLRAIMNKEVWKKLNRSCFWWKSVEFETFCIYVIQNTRNKPFSNPSLSLKVKPITLLMTILTIFFKQNWPNFWEKNTENVNQNNESWSTIH